MPLSTRLFGVAAVVIVVVVLFFGTAFRQFEITGAYGELARTTYAVLNIQTGVQPPVIVDPGKRKERFDLSEHECKVLFPALYHEIDVAKARGKIVAADIANRDGQHGFVRARIQNGNLYIISRGSDVHHRMFATLSSIYRALITAPEDAVIPNIEFTFCVNDHPASNAWSLARSERLGEVNNTWLMPDYGFWSWPEPKIGPVSEAREVIAREDSQRAWTEKIDKIVWRGVISWNAKQRGSLLAASKQKTWADVEHLIWGRNDLSIADFCKYRYIAYTEGVTYSGRLKYHQLCRSVVISTEMQWRTTLSPLLIESGSEQNIVIVKDDWSDLQEKVEWLQAHPVEAETIANNSLKTFKNHYMASGAETCYWRELFRGWADVTEQVGELEGKELGVRWESVMLMGTTQWEKYA